MICFVNAGSHLMMVRIMQVQNHGSHCEQVEFPIIEYTCVLPKLTAIRALHHAPSTPLVSMVPSNKTALANPTRHLQA
jgi:hypothetical protein